MLPILSSNFYSNTSYSKEFDLPSKKLSDFLVFGYMTYAVSEQILKHLKNPHNFLPSFEYILYDKMYDIEYF